MRDQIFTLRLTAVLFAISLFSSCSTQNPVAFGDRKFYPNAVAGSSKKNIPPIVSEQKTNSKAELSAAIVSELAEGQNQSSNKPTLVERATATQKGLAKVLSEKPKLGFKEKIALKLLTKSFTAQGTSSANDKITPGSAIAGFILSLIGIFVAGLILGTLGVIFSAIALSKPSDQYRNGFAIAGLILGIIAIIGALIVIASL